MQSTRRSLGLTPHFYETIFSTRNSISRLGAVALPVFSGSQPHYFTNTNKYLSNRFFSTFTKDEHIKTKDCASNLLDEKEKLALSVNLNPTPTSQRSESDASIVNFLLTHPYYSQGTIVDRNDFTGVNFKDYLVEQLFIIDCINLPKKKLFEFLTHPVNPQHEVLYIEKGQRCQHGAIKDYYWLSKCENTISISTNNEFEIEDLQLFKDLNSIIQLEVSGGDKETSKNFSWLPKTLKYFSVAHDDHLTGEGFEDLSSIEYLKIHGCKNFEGRGLEHLSNLGRFKLFMDKESNLLPKTLRTLTNLKSLELVHNRKSVDACFEEISFLSNLSSLHLENGGVDSCFITGNRIKWLASLKLLKDLTLIDYELTNSGWEELRGLVSAETLHIKRCNITDQALEHFLKLDSLKKLMITDCTEITKSGIDKLETLMSRLPAEKSIVILIDFQEEISHIVGPRKLFEFENGSKLEVFNPFRWAM